MLRSLAPASALLLLSSPALAEGAFHVVHPGVSRGAFELESLNAVSLGPVPGGEERSVHELALGYGVTSFWKTTLAVELANLQGGGVEAEALEWENLFMLPVGEGPGAHAHGHSHAHAHDAAFAWSAGVYARLEAPFEGGIGDGALVFGPVAEVSAHGVTLIGNLFLETPFGDEDPGLAYAVSAMAGIGGGVQAGFEAHGGVEDAFGDTPAFGDQAHYAGPALAATFDLDGRSLTPRAAVLFGLTDGAADAALSLNLELSF
ncbi:hypothetical protein [Albimonas pacifica]|uniref:MetA-pathway of phenol degradation n=1 Tax=Albimonas pacifica TaxID=1114924 RepID=A0A1I3DFV9_9RHOB|nr:hypothetical protein [Albimonas pacifica]SFH85361.1 hypothetical protein SAMN05216258_102555 [Albimonas pacifica]